MNTASSATKCTGQQGKKTNNQKEFSAPSKKKKKKRTDNHPPIIPKNFAVSSMEDSKNVKRIVRCQYSRRGSNHLVIIRKKNASFSEIDIKTINHPDACYSV